MMFPEAQIQKRRSPRTRRAQSGLTLLELILTCAILLILSATALPIARYALIRQKETELRHALQEVRDAIDRYKDAADHNQIRTEMGSEGYPPDLDSLTKPIPLGTAGGASGDKKIRFLRSVPIDPMTGRADWGLRSVSDDFDSQNWGGKNVFDIYSQSRGTAMDGTKYADW